MQARLPTRKRRIRQLRMVYPPVSASSYSPYVGIIQIRFLGSKRICFLSASPAPHFVFQSAYCNFQLSLFNIPLFSHLRKSLTNFLKHLMIQTKTGEPDIRLRGNQISTLRPDVDHATVGRTLTYAFFTEMPTLGVS